MPWRNSARLAGSSAAPSCKGLDQRTKGGEGGAQLVGDVGDEVAADGFGLAEVGQVAEEHQALPQAGDAERDGDGVDFAFGGADGQQAGGGLIGWRRGRG